MSRILPLSLLAVALLSACGDRAEDTNPNKWVSKRQAIFKNFTRTLEPMGLVARGRQDYVKGDFMASAQALQELSAQPWPLFPADSNYPPTRAKPAVWQQPAGFKQAQDDFQASVARLTQVSGSGDQAAIRKAVNDVQDSCKRCHDEYRFER